MEFFSPEIKQEAIAFIEYFKNLVAEYDTRFSQAR
jgi:hypothetical protein